MSYSLYRVCRIIAFNVHGSVHRNNLVYNSNKMHKSQKFFSFICLRGTTLSYDVAHPTVRS
jgi:hypothetical protein